MATYRAVMLTRKGGPEVLETVELAIREPGPREARVRVLACGAGGTDILMRRGYYPFGPKIPFVQGYDVVGEVDALGPDVTNVKVGDKVAALTVHGGFAELLYRGADELVPVPPGLDDAEVVALILNYATAYQMVHRVAKQAPGETALVTGANGGVGLALLELLQLERVITYGVAGKRSHDVVRQTELDPTLPRVPGDRIQLQQVFLNLIVNAIEAMSGIDDRPRVLTIVSMHGSANSVAVEVRDTGSGLDPLRVDQVFQAFYTTKEQGVGIGLSISRSIIEAHGGRLSAGPNQPHGAIFRLSLPIAGEEQA